ncbi:HupE/UreJ family protein [Ramlibacter tataouinensis]|uniref:HupE/UreJ family protein n=1 Tax=Ramlibacter tataouinensis TaxID=94132 RepID=UPI0022F3EFA3|nr:HupE/UreJ family protein [Ramlibacter tataouinensis]WBY00573.1 HupE/UreJ family protein [Ramlibacter tataouinensis]
MRRSLLPALSLAVLSLPVLAHTGEGAGHHAFAEGFTHPLLGIDHVVAMLAVGLWARVLGGKALWLLPTCFVLCMVGGWTLAVAGAGLPLVEPLVAGSVFVLGALIAIAGRLPPALSALLVGALAVFHGHAHGTSLQGAAPAFGLGLVAATALLHATGLALGQWLASRRRGGLTRGIGAAIADVGLVLLGAAP